MTTRIAGDASSTVRPHDVPGLATLLAGYRPFPNVVDEMVDAHGGVRAHWGPFLHGIGALGAEGLAARFAAADRHLHESGVFYRVYADPVGERAWPLSHVPLLISHEEWASIVAGVTQRARLLEAVLRDVYGKATLVQSGGLPAAVIAGSPEFLRPLHGVTPPNGQFLHLYAADLGRGPDGRWWVLGDRGQAPSGAGYAIENRLALSRALPELARTLGVARLADFYQALRRRFASMTQQEESRIGLLSPGPHNETYFEHAYLARFLGLMLVEGSDLSVHDDLVYVRTVHGLKRVEVLLRRLDSDFADPLELNPSSRLGVPGLVQAVRHGSVLLANALGTGFIESRALLGFVPQLAPRVIGEDLLMPNVATWWCGQAKERQFVLDNLAELAIAPAFTARMPELLEQSPLAVGEIEPASRDRIADAIRWRGSDFVAQELVGLSTMPAWENGTLRPRPFTLRVFASVNEDGEWTVMPGGFCRVSQSDDARAVSMQAGGRSADVWVLPAEPARLVTLAAGTADVPIRRGTGNLPSRAADNLFWLGRYLQRTEATLRIVQALAYRNLGSDGADEAAATIGALTYLLVAWGAVPSTTDPLAAPGLTMHSRELPGALPALAGAMRRTAAVIRDRLSPDAWRSLGDLVARLESREAAHESTETLLERCADCLRIVAAFAGLVTDNMNRGAGWRFMQLGRRIERAMLTCRLARTLAGPAAIPSQLDALLELGDCVMTYRARYLLGAARLPVLDLVVLDLSNPRSLAFQIERINNHLSELPGHPRPGVVDRLARTSVMLHAHIQTLEPPDLTTDRLVELESGLMALSDSLAQRYFTQSAPVAATPEPPETLG